MKNIISLGSGFTLIEMLVVVSIIGILITISSFGLQGAREGARDSRRQSDLEAIRTALELYRSDCGAYPASLTLGAALNGSGNPSRCDIDNVYMSEVPDDPLTPARTYWYKQLTNTTYELCTALEEGTGTASCGGSCTEACNYRVTSP